MDSTTLNDPLWYTILVAVGTAVVAFCRWAGAMIRQAFDGWLERQNAVTERIQAGNILLAQWPEVIALIRDTHNSLQHIKRTLDELEEDVDAVKQSGTHTQPEPPFNPQPKGD